MKKCKKCGIKKPYSEYYRNATFSDGYSSSCRGCKKEYQSRWRENNRAKHRDYSKQYYRDHRDERAEYYSNWRKDNYEYTKECQMEWRRKNPDRMKARRKIENARRRAMLENADGDYTVDEWLDLKEHYDNTCLACGESEPDVKITPDHVIPLAMGGSNSIDNIQPLCWGCNARKQARIKDYRAKNGHQLPKTA